MSLGWGWNANDNGFGEKLVERENEIGEGLH